MEVEEQPATLPSPPRQSPSWPASGEGWGPDQPLPSRREPITGGGPGATSAALSPSRPEPITEEERGLMKRRVIRPITIRGDEGDGDLPEAPIKIRSLSLSPSEKQRHDHIKAMIAEIEMELQERSSEEEDMGGPSVDVDTEARPTEGPVPPDPTSEEARCNAPTGGGSPHATS